MTVKLVLFVSTRFRELLFWTSRTRGTLYRRKGFGTGSVTRRYLPGPECHRSCFCLRDATLPYF